MNIFIDIDETIATRPFFVETDGAYNYAHAVPIEENIKKANKLYEEGHQITYWTGRGAFSDEDWREVTKNQLNEWGCKYHELQVGVPKPWDVVIDNTALNVNEWTNDRVKKQFNDD